ncbi:MAG TPA: hypothetical protein VJT71_10010 [Pyrinomonadaceae bacterium]|nr:hypothetical protein [Pyrinomonadaceae bacterium]
MNNSIERRLSKIENTLGALPISDAARMEQAITQYITVLWLGLGVRATREHAKAQLESVVSFMRQNPGLDDVGFVMKYMRKTHGHELTPEQAMACCEKVRTCAGVGQ